ncbi:coiled-coil domain-containing protein 116 [Sceloporus undulatus]|uniref:coiled-coil domain-containing protein 116 n=1 Tax=Sceloporus undulatus TaxID=8520 RepID=UPI001C4B1446|nr:coiled-coil domain-containing protein 116 [Sceloporus undulatus]
MPRPTSRCPLWNQDSTASASTSTSPAFASRRRGRGKHHKSGGSIGESNHLANEFSEFVDFLADEDVLDSLQCIMEDAVRKLRDVTTEDGERLFDIQEESVSSVDSESWSFSYSSTRSQSKYQTTSTTSIATTSSSSEDDWERRTKTKRGPKPRGKMCLLDKYAARLPKLEKKNLDQVSGGFHAEAFSERSGDSYFFRQEHLHIWAKLAESFEQFQPLKKDYFAKFRKGPPEQSLSVESLQKEITNVLKRPTPSSIPLYYPGQEPFQSLDFLEENKILAALQDIINQAVHKVLSATGPDGVPLLNLFDDEETSEDGDSKSEGSKSTDGKKRKKKKGKKKKKRKAESPKEEKGKPKYTPPPLPKSKRKSLGPEEPQRKPKYVPPPLPKTKPRPPPETPPPKPKYVPPPLPKPKQKKKDSIQLEAEAPKQPVLTKHIITPKDIKRARLQARPLPKQSVIDFLLENAAKLILYKYNYETLLSSKLGLISVPVTKVLLEIMFGYKKVKGSGIRLSSQIDWTKVYDEIYAPRPPKPKTPKLKPGDKKKGKGKKKKAGDIWKKSADKKSVFFKSETPGGKVIAMQTPTTEEDLESMQTRELDSATEQEEYEGPDIFEIVPPQFPEGGETDEFSADEEIEGSLIQASHSGTRAFVTTPIDSPMRSVASEDKMSSGTPQGSEVPSPALSPKKSVSSRKVSVVQDSPRGSQTLLPELVPTGPPSNELVRKSSSRKSSFAGEGSKIILPKISN